MPLPLLRFPIKFGSIISDVFLILIHEIIAVKHRPCLPGADFHDRFFVHSSGHRPAPMLPTSTRHVIGITKTRDHKHGFDGSDETES